MKQTFRFSTPVSARRWSSIGEIPSSDIENPPPPRVTILPPQGADIAAVSVTRGYRKAPSALFGVGSSKNRQPVRISHRFELGVSAKSTG